MTCSILIVSHNRKIDLQKSLAILKMQIDIKTTEVLVFLDGCTDDSAGLQSQFPFVYWILSPVCLGASAARAKIYPLAKSEILIGLDDDAHFLTLDFLSTVNTIFNQQPNTAIVAFEEVKGVFQNDLNALQKAETDHKNYLCSEFIGCGFAVRKSMYLQTNGFPTWIDIYGEEACLSIEVLSKGFDIVYNNAIKVNHRVDIQKRRAAGKNYFRFGKQLKNVAFYYLVYYKKPLIPILKLFLHNARKYAFLDVKYFFIFFKTIIIVVFNSYSVLKFRNTIDDAIFSKLKKMNALKY